ncbi:hypothetical protein RHGRI_005272 [Rhododendron griersonianum]|uniref:Polygalacturonase n=1 Tax=Rhododendron griersonianum TaxID=479676 RepID=A0AAV6LCF8_9ERIC|nr:hypothetical protein RHGRI_005272 [Rhododendron griersonianum]
MVQSMASLTPLVVFLYLSLATAKHWDVVSLGAKGDGQTDSTNPFLKAWAAACGSVQPATIYVPPGRYLLGQVKFYGSQCKNSHITIRINGTLVAPSDYRVLGNANNWLLFEQTLEFSKSNNILISGLTSVNSQMFHTVIYRCTNVKVQAMKISASANSPNTDGIHVESSSTVSIYNSMIATGDDCISIGPGTSNLWIENIACGPGHGISIGSLGKKFQEAGVRNVTVSRVAFTGTQNGVRIKTWAKPSTGFVTGVVFQHATMVNVQNPVIIDQNYCPNNEGCPNQASGIRISNVTYRDIHGSSATTVAVNFDCSKEYPCNRIILEDVNLSYGNKHSQAACANVEGSASGLVTPSSCL